MSTSVDPKRPQSWSSMAKRIYQNLPSDAERREKPAQPSQADWWNVRRAQAPRDPWRELQQRRK
jgi:hypothetical protein